MIEVVYSSFEYCQFSHIAISSHFRCQRISEKRKIDNLTFFGINLTLFYGKQDMCQKTQIYHAHIKLILARFCFVYAFFY